MSQAQGGPNGSGETTHKLQASAEETIRQPRPKAPSEHDTHPGVAPPGREDGPPCLRGHPRYEVLELIGTGGMGTVYKARHRLMDRLVALKVIRPDLVGDPAMAARFRREAQAAARLNHPNIVHAY